MNVEVVHVKDYGKETRRIGNDLYLYCGRGSKYGNPYVMKSENDRDSVIKSFEKDTNMQESVSLLIKKLQRDGEDIETLKLGCFCAPKPCHCDVIKKRIDREVIFLKDIPY